MQLLEKHRAESDYESSRVSADKRQVPWLLTTAERKALPVGVFRKLRQLEREEERMRTQLPGSVAKLLKGCTLKGPKPPRLPLDRSAHCKPIRR